MAKIDKREERRASILAAAGKVFHEKGLEGATTLDIATAAGVSKRDLYAVFPSKDLILAGLIETGVKQFAAPVDFPAPKSRQEVLATLEAFGHGFLMFLLSAEPTSLYRIAIAMADRDPTAGRALLSAGIDGTTARVSAYVKAASAAGHLRILETDHDAAVATFFNAAIGHLQMRRLLDPGSNATRHQVTANIKLAIRVMQSFETPELR